jgi:LuxR family maltose regulon positive regulatory protein
MLGTELLISTKLHPPFIRQGLVVRPKLQARILAGISGPLTLITAPTGFGKTTLVATNLVESHIPLA